MLSFRALGFSHALRLTLGASVLLFACSKKANKSEPSIQSSSPPVAAHADQSPATTPAPASPAVNPSALPVPATQIEVTMGNMFYKTADGSVLTWGVGGNMIGDGKAERTKPVAVAALAGTARLARGGGMTMCAAMKDGTAKCWGNGASGELGNGKDSESTVPVVIPGVSNVVDIALGNDFACALIGGGTVTCWGSNSQNQVSPAHSSLEKPTAVAGVAGAVQITAGNSTACALGEDGSVKCWGLACGSQFASDCDKPYTLASLAGATSIVVGWQFACAVAKDSTVQCWGDNDEGELGNGTNTTDHKIGTVKGLTGARNVVAGSHHVCALMKDATVQCWGSNEQGQLGDGTLPNNDDKVRYRATPAPVKGLTGVTSLTCGVTTCCAQLADKSAKCWGENRSEQMFGEANASDVTFSTPVVVPVQ